MIAKSRFLVVYALLCATALYLNLHRDLGVPMKKRFDQFPGTVSSWRMVSESTLPESVQRVLKASEVMCREYVNADGQRVELYVGYHNGGQGAGEIHSPKHCLPGSGWFELSTARRQLDVAGGKLNLVRAVYQKGGSRQLFLYWYQVRDTSLSDEYSLKVAEIVNSALHRRRDASFIRVAVPCEASEEKAAAVGERFVSDFFPTLRAFLPS